METAVKSMTIRELADKAGTVVTVPLGGLSVRCIVVDMRVSYGVEQYLIQPLEGSGQVWKEARLTTPWEKKNAAEPVENSSTQAN